MKRLLCKNKNNKHDTKLIFFTISYIFIYFINIYKYDVDSYYSNFVNKIYIYISNRFIMNRARLLLTTINISFKYIRKKRE